MTTAMNLLADSYDAAADYIEQHGWYQGGLSPYVAPNESRPDLKIRDMQGPVCAMGAAYAIGCTNKAVGSGEGKFSEINSLSEWHDRLVQEIPNKFVFVADWNDAPGRTKEEVIDVLRMTATKVRMGNIGDNPREYEFQPMPQTEPMVEPAAPQPSKEPVPA